MKASSKSTTQTQPIQASEEAVVVVEDAAPEAVCPTCDCKYAAALDLISAAIESLAEVARDDQIAKDSIANLGVVMLDLKGGC